MFGYHCKYGHWDEFVFNENDAGKLQAMADALKTIQKSLLWTSKTLLNVVRYFCKDNFLTSLIFYNLDTIFRKAILETEMIIAQIANKQINRDFKNKYRECQKPLYPAKLSTNEISSCVQIVCTQIKKASQYFM